MKNFYKAFLCCSLFFLNSQVFAHPSDSLPLMNIGKGTRLIIQKDLNIPSGYEPIKFENGDNSEGNKLRRCLFSAQAREYDRVLRANRVLTITRIEDSTISSDPYPEGQRTSLTIDDGDYNSGKIYEINCFFNMTIGEFKDLLKGSVKVKLAKPKEI